MVTAAEAKAEELRIVQQNEENKSFLTAIKGALGDNTEGKLQIFVKDKRTNKYNYLSSKPYSRDEIDEIQSTMRDDFPEGADLQIKIYNTDNVYLGITYLALAPLPMSERKRLRMRDDNTTAPAQSQNSDILALMMQMNEARARDAEKSNDRFMQMMAENNKTTMQMMALMFNKDGVKSESATDSLLGLAKVMEIMRPQQNGLKDTLELLSVAKRIVEPDAGDGGFGEIGKGLMSFLPAIAAGMSKAAENQSPQPVPVQSPQPVQQAAYIPNPSQLNGPQESDPMLRILKLQKLFKGLIDLLDLGVEADKVPIYIKQQIDRGNLSSDDVEFLIEQLESGGDDYRPILIQIGTPTYHLETLSRGIALYIAELDYDPEDDGQGGNAANPEINGAIVEGGSQQESNQIESSNNRKRSKSAIERPISGSDGNI